jgi:tripartite-type tricarboxylate transporter receptor subunit TctC
MSLSRFSAASVAGVAGLLVAQIASAQSAYPARNVTLLVPFSPGGSTDLITRIIAKELSTQFDRQVIADNRTGGGGVIGWSAVAKAAPDGYTVLATELSFAIAAGLIPNLPFDPRKDFIQVTTATTVPHVLVITPSLPVRNVKEFIALVKARPNELNYGSGGNGTNTHLGSELLKNLTGIRMVHVPYKGAGAVLQDLMGGQVQALVSAVPTVVPYVNAKRLRALMVTDEKRTRVLPDVPSAAEAGLAKMNMQFWVGFAVPAGTPQAVVERLNQALGAVLNGAESKKRLIELGVDTVGNTPAQANKLVLDEMDRWTAVIKAAGIKAE